MAGLLTALLSVLLVLLAVALEQPSSDPDHPQTRPHFRGCISRDMETFRCRWNVGTFQNVPGDVRMFYIKKHPSASPNVWSECPLYGADRGDECFFDKNHTSIWTSYGVQLRSRDLEVVYDELVFNVENIVHPDPPVSLNWTLLNMGMTGTHFDVLVSWESPASADVRMGWMTLQYELQSRQVNSSHWNVMDLGWKGTQCSLYGLQTDMVHEVKVRCKMLASTNFGEFSNSIFIHIPTEEPRFPVAILLVFTTLCLVAVLMLVIVSQQRKLMVILLPPVPGPKIKGIDPELLKKGKLSELTSILGGHPDLRPELYSDSLWVEFIELDLDESDGRLTNLDTECLVDRSPSSDRPPPLSVGCRDDDSGRASCCDPDLTPDPDASSPFHPLLPNATLEPPGPDHPSAPVLDYSPASPGGESPWAVLHGRDELYAQVGEVRLSGQLMLTPEEQKEAEETLEKDARREKEGRKQRLRLLLVVKPDRDGYTSELDAGRMSTRPDQPGQEDVSPEQSQDVNPERGSSGAEDPPPVSPPPRPAPPVSAYTMVEGVDTQNSLLLKPNPPPAPRPVLSKATPTPEGYLTPDLLGHMTP